MNSGVMAYFSRRKLTKFSVFYGDPSLFRYQVQAPYETRPGEIPRRIQIERKRRLYAQHKIETVLSERGIDYSRGPTSSLAFLSPSIQPLPVEVRTLGCRGSLHAVDATVK